MTPDRRPSSNTKTDTYIFVEVTPRRPLLEKPFVYRHEGHHMGTYELRSYGGEQQDRQNGCTPVKNHLIWQFFRLTFLWNGPRVKWDKERERSQELGQCQFDYLVDDEVFLISIIANVK